MIPEIPVSAWKVFDVGTKGHQTASRPQAAPRLPQSCCQARFVRKVFKEVACKHQVQSVVGNRPGQRAVLLQKANVGIQMPLRVRVQIHAVTDSRPYLIDKFSVPASQIKHRAVRSEVTREEI